MRVEKGYNLIISQFSLYCIHAHMITASMSKFLFISTVRWSFCACREYMCCVMLCVCVWVCDLVLMRAFDLSFVCLCVNRCICLSVWVCGCVGVWVSGWVRAVCVLVCCVRAFCAMRLHGPAKWIFGTYAFMQIHSLSHTHRDIGVLCSHHFDFVFQRLLAIKLVEFTWNWEV